MDYDEDLFSDCFDSGIFSKELQAFWLLSQLQIRARAARIMNITTVSFTTYIHNLERAMKCVLIQQNTPTNGFHLTDEGVALQKQTAYLLQIARDALSESHQKTEQLEGQITIGAFPSATLIFIPKLLSIIKAEHPHLTVKVRERSTTKIFQMVREGTLDIGIVRMTDKAENIHEADLKAFDLYQEKTYIVINKNHTLAKKKFVSWEELATEDLLMLSNDQGPMRSQIMRRFEEARVTPHILCEGAESLTLLRMVAQNAGITIVSQRSLALATHLREFLHILSPETRPIELYTGVILRSRGYIPRTIQYIRETLLKIEADYTIAPKT